MVKSYFSILPFMENLDYMARSLRFLADSGLAEKIINSRRDFKITYREIPTHIVSKYNNYKTVESPRYYRFLFDYLLVVLSLVEDSPNKGSIKFTSKYLEMDC